MADQKTDTAAALADELLEVIFDAQPLFATLVGIRGRDHLLADLSERADAEAERRFDAVIERAERMTPASDEDRLTRDIVVHFARSERDLSTIRPVEYTVTDLFVAPASLLLSMLPQVSMPDAASAEGYLERLRAIPRYLEAAAERHRNGTKAGRTAVRHLAEAAIRQIEGYLADPAHDPLAGNDAPADLAGFTERREAVLAESVRPAFARYRDAVRADVVPAARDEEHAGLCWLPGGDDLYATLVEVHTTAGRTPEELHQLGLDVIDRLAEEYAELGRRVFGLTSLPEIFERLRTDPALRYKDAEEIRQVAEEAIARAETVAPQWFGKVPQERCRVQEVPADISARMPGAYYLQASLDGSRPGTYFVNTHEPTSRHRHEAESIAFHEGVPGHHFQSAISLGLGDLPLLRRIVGSTAYGEGWGLYSERLDDEMGLYSDDVARLGMLTADSLRAARLVVDTGLHALGWSREQAVAYCRDNTPSARNDIEVEIDRYIADPGQALAYMVGRLEIQRIRAAAQDALGDKFDMRQFHDVVLGSGEIPLEILESLVMQWAAQRKEA